MINQWFVASDYFLSWINSAHFSDSFSDSEKLFVEVPF